MARSVTLEAKCFLPVNIENAWRLITDTSVFHSLRLPGTYSNFDHKSAKRGTEFKCQSLFGGENMNRVIVDWEAPYEFSFGSNVEDWTYKWRLNRLEAEKCEAVFWRKFKAKSSIIQVFSKPKYSEEQSLTDDTIRALRTACENLANGKEDGLDRAGLYG